MAVEKVDISGYDPTTGTLTSTLEVTVKPAVGTDNSERVNIKFEDTSIPKDIEISVKMSDLTSAIDTITVGAT